MACQALFLKACNSFASVGVLLKTRPLTLNINVLPTSRGLKQEVAETLKMLKIPEKPKKPPSPYLRFVMEHRKKVLKENPNLKQTEIIKKCAEDWRNISNDTKENYNAVYKSESQIYSEKILDFYANLSPEQKKALDVIEQEKKEEKDRRKIKKIYKETNKPKRPMGPYAIFLKEQSKLRTLSPNEIMTKLKDEWHSLPESEKNNYKNQYLKEKEKYEVAMEEWESKMLKEGRNDLVRVKSGYDHPKPSRISQVKKTKTE